MMSNVVIEVVDFKYDQETNKGFVTAVIEDFSVARPATYEDPCEMGPALCESEFELSEDDEIPTDENELEIFFQDLNLDWKEVNQSDDYSYNEQD